MLRLPKNLPYWLLVVCSVFACGAHAAVVDPLAPFREWQRVRKPVAGEALAIGNYSAGCLQGAARLPLDGPGYSVMRPSRQRYFGHPSLVAYLEALARRTKQSGVRILVGDLGRAPGGPMISGHASHQIGLDADIWFHFPARAPKARERETWGAPSHVTASGALKKSWNDRYRQLLALAADDPAVDRIFVHAAIKKDMCARHADAPWLRKLRPWWGHDDHLHVRLVCPANSPACARQEEIAAGNGCGAELDWWFSAEAREELAKRKLAPAGRVFPVLPDACADLLARGRAGS